MSLTQPYRVIMPVPRRYNLQAKQSCNSISVGKKIKQEATIINLQLDVSKLLIIPIQKVIEEIYKNFFNPC